MGISSRDYYQIMYSCGGVCSYPFPYISSSDGDHSFYLNGVLQDRVVSFTGFTFSLGPGSNLQPVLFVGGIDQGVIAEIDDVPTFRGCLRDFSYNFG